MAIKTGKELATAAKNVVRDHKTLYVMGCFGAPMNATNKSRYKNNHSYNKNAVRQKKIDAASADTFGFDCVCFIKGLLWGWTGDASKTYGGAKYASNGVPDISADGMITKCTEVSTDFSKIQVGEFLWMKGHCGIYLGDGLAVEATPKWSDCVQITAVHNIGRKDGYNGRTWTKHGKLPYVTYEAEPKKTTEITVKLPVLKKGAKGNEVKALQALLIGYGYEMKSGNTVYGVDGSFGGATDKAVRAFKKDHDLEADGSVGSATWSKLLGV